MRMLYVYKRSLETEYKVKRGVVDDDEWMNGCKDESGMERADAVLCLRHI